MNAASPLGLKLKDVLKYNFQEISTFCSFLTFLDNLRL